MEQKKTKNVAPPRYDDAFRAGAIRLVTEQHRPAREVAEELGICTETLRCWLKATGVNPGNAERNNRDLRRLRELEAENRALRKQVTEKDEVIDVLKKSVGILSKP
jgi:transposase-like protein